MFARKHSRAGLLIWVTVVFAAGADDTKPVSFYHDVVPVLKRSCTGCHHPDKLKGELDLTTYVAFQKGDVRDRKSTRLNSSHLGISYAVFCLKKKKIVVDLLAFV